MPQLSCHDLSLGYDGKTVVSGLSFSVNAGDYLCVIGENGSGKSTLVKALLKLKNPLSGSITSDEGLMPDEIGYLPQQTAAQKDFPASVREVVRSGCLNRTGLRPFYSREEKQMAEDNMEKFGIADLARKCYRELSGGQQQRALLARALCATRKMLLLDEPAAGLDPAVSAEMYELIQKLNGEGITVVMVSHDISASVKYASHILHIGMKTALFFGETAAYLKSGTGGMFLQSKAELA
ncbi:MAG: ABC transporter ATP-binding protein [Clostridiales bacterium]|jgi:zinc transport system ATP-binding protein|nr:ABC transporter ATP-binding protein [Clostridiales bacterium]